jgi:hypothetical protein
MGSPRTEAGREDGPEGKSELRHYRQIGRTFAIAAHEVTVEQFLRLWKDKKFGYRAEFSRDPNHPINMVSWYQAAEYCNLLSAAEGIPKEQWCYEPNAEGEYAEGMKVKRAYLGLRGYRLPSEAEWEYACRAGSVTARYYGEAEDLLGRYAWYTKNSLDRWMLPVGSLKPNDLGLFDVQGNAMEWCHERVFLYGPGKPGGPYKDNGDISDIRDTRNGKLESRLLRGGSFRNRSRIVRSSVRNGFRPANRNNGVGFRPARTFPRTSLHLYDRPKAGAEVKIIATYNILNIYNLTSSLLSRRAGKDARCPRRIKSWWSSRRLTT